MLGGPRWRAAATALVAATATLAGSTTATTAATAATTTPTGPGGITVTEILGPEGEPTIEVRGVNERGQVLARVERPPVGWFPFSAAVLWQRGRATVIDPPATPPPPTGGILTVPAEISNGGVIAGSRIHVSGFVRWPFSWSGGTYTALDPEIVDQGRSGTAVAVNQRGQVLGSLLRATSDPDDPFEVHVEGTVSVWEGSRPVASVAAAAWPVDLNDRGRALLDVITDETTLTRQAAVWRVGADGDGAVTRLGTLGGAQSIGAAINQRGDVVGTSTTATGDEHAFVWRDGRMTDLGTLGGTTTVIGAPEDSPSWFPIGDHALNEWGDIVGTSTTAAGDDHAFLWRRGRMTDLGTLGGAGSRALAINEWGQVVGTSQTGDGVWHAFLWQNGRMTDLGALAADGRSVAVDVNNRGQVAGTASGRGGVLWTL